MNKKVLSTTTENIILHMAPLLAPLPDQAKLAISDSELLEQTNKLIGEISLFFRWGLLIALKLFNILPFLSGYGFRRFVNLSNENKKNYIHEWFLSQNHIKRDFFKGIKGIIALVVLSNKNVWPQLNYYPEAHIKERINLRSEIMKNK